MKASLGNKSKSGGKKKRRRRREDGEEGSSDEDDEDDYDDGEVWSGIWLGARLLPIYIPPIFTFDIFFRPFHFVHLFFVCISFPRTFTTRLNFSSFL